MTDERDESSIPVRLARRGDGFAASGPDFYVWDLDARTVAHDACDLAEASAVSRGVLARSMAAGGATAPRVSVTHLPLRRHR